MPCLQYNLDLFLMSALLYLLTKEVYSVSFSNASSLLLILINCIPPHFPPSPFYNYPQTINMKFSLVASMSSMVTVVNLPLPYSISLWRLSTCSAGCLSDHPVTLNKFWNFAAHCLICCFNTSNVNNVFFRHPSYFRFNSFEIRHHISRRQSGIKSRLILYVLVLRLSLGNFLIDEYNKNQYNISGTYHCMSLNVIEKLMTFHVIISYPLWHW
jgi:hypothetical protein